MSSGTQLTSLHVKGGAVVQGSHFVRRPSFLSNLTAAVYVQWPGVFIWLSCSILCPKL